MKAKGFPISKYGYTMPNVDIVALNNIQPIIEIIPEPKANIGTISVKGEFTLSFNQEMISPEIVDQTFYKNVFKATITSSLYDKFTNCRIGWTGKRTL